MTPEDALNYITAGHGRATLVGKSCRYTYRFGCPKGKKTPIFVRLLTGPSNESDFRYIGCLVLEGLEEPGRIRPYWRLVAGKKGMPEAPGFKALKWYMQAIQRHKEAAEQAQFMHEGICGKCGRPLTVPESIESGIGPICAEKIG